MFARGGKQTGGKQTNQFNRKADVTQKEMQKRLWGRLGNVMATAPPQAKQKWAEICDLKGKPGCQIREKKKQFLYAWVSDPQWTDAYFSQKVNLTETNEKKLEGTWVTRGRLETLIGKEETNTAIEEGWYKTKPGVGSQLLVRYTEESRTVTEQKEIEN